MPRPSLTPDVAIDVRLSATCSRHCYDPDAAACLAELRTVAGGRVDLLVSAVAAYVAGYRGEYTERLCAGLLEAFPDAATHPRFAEVARRRGVSYT